MDFRKEIQKLIKSNGKIINLKVLGTIKDLKNIGEGGASLVYSGKFEGLEIAIKILCSIDKIKNKRFLSEFYNIQKLTNKNIVKYITLDKIIVGQEQLFVIVMKKYKRSFKKENKNPPTINDFNKLLNFLLDTLEFIHKEKIIHRDIKPENILIDDDEKYVLSDFGIANYFDTSHIKNNTQPKERLGNRNFSAPEQEEYGVLAKETMDIYAMGQTLYRYVTGDRIAGTGQNKISSIIKNLDSGIDKMISKCTNIQPEKRFQSITEIREFLETIKKKEPLYYINLFDEICRSIFPKKDNYNISYTADPKKIDDFFYKLAENKKIFGDYLWYNYSTNGKNIGNMYFHPHKIQGMRKFAMGGYKEIGNRTKGIAYDIKEIWVYRDVNEMKDFVLIHYNKGNPVIIDGKKRYDYYLLDNKHIVSFQEGDDGYAEVDGKTYDLSEYPGEFIEIEKNNGIVFIGTRFNTVIDEKYDQEIINFTKKYLEKNIKLSNETIGKFGNSLKTSPLTYEEYGIYF